MKKKTIQILSISFFALTLIWGVYTLIYYMGVPYHGMVLMERPVFDALMNSCGPGDYICRGLHSFWHIIENSVKQLGPFYGYTIVSIALFALVVGWISLRTGSMRIRFKMRPWMLVVAFIASLWLVFTFFSLRGTENMPARRIVEPLPQVYKNVGPEGLETLQENLDDLQDRGCLNLIGQFDNSARAYEIKHRCIQTSFVTKVLSLVVLILFFIFELLVLGRAALGWLRLKPKDLFFETILSTGLGACFLIAILWFMAVISLHVPFLALFTKATGWVMLAIIPLAGFKHSKYWIKKFLFHSWEFDRSWRDPVILLSWLLLTYLTFNFLSVVRPFPIGWDDLGSYLNRPRVMVSYGHFIFSMAPFFWEYLTSLGYLLFGYESFFGASAAMMINWSVGLFAVLAIFAFANYFLGRSAGLLSAILYYALPMVGHFSFADMKIDNAVFLMGTLSTFCVFKYLFGRDLGEEEEKDSKSIMWLALAGIFAGFAFAIKFTGVMVIVALGAVIVGAMLHWSALVGAAFLSITLFSRFALNIERTLERLFGGESPIPPDLIPIIFAIIGIAILGFVSWKFKSKLKKTVVAITIFGACVIFSISPWVMHNNILHERVVPKLALKAPNNVTPYINPYGEDGPKNTVVRGLGPDLAVDQQHERCSPTGGVEELDRYWGFEKGIGHYLTLPWRTTMNLDSTGYYVTTTPVLLLIPLVLLLPFFWMRKGRWLRWLFVGTVFMLIEWMFLANGIPWYGIGTFLGLIVLIEVLAAKAPDKFGKISVNVFIAVALLMMYSMRMWQYDTQKNLLEYSSGKASAEVMIERTVPHYNDIAKIVIERSKQIPDRPYLYRMGTFIPYFIPRNLEVIGIQDHQLDVFNCLYQERDGKLLVKRLKALGFNSIIFDTNTATIERDPNGTLHQKVNAFLEWANDPENGLQIVISDAGGGVAYMLIP